MALINFGPGPSEDPVYNNLLLQEFRKRAGLGSASKKAVAPQKMQSGTIPEGLAYLANSALEGYLEGRQERALQKAMMDQQQAAVDSASGTMGGLPASIGGGSGGGRRSSSASAASSPREAITNAMLYSPDTPAPTLAAENLSRTMSLPPEVAGEPIVNGPTAFGDPTAILQPGVANPETAAAPMTLPAEVAGSPSARDSIVAAMMPHLSAPAGPRISTANWTPEDRDMAIRTTYGEASNQGAEGQQAVAAVIANRVNSSGMSPRDVMLAKNQFEPWNNAEARARMENLPKDSPEYKRIESTLTPLFEGRVPDPTGGATHFYAPKAQAALGRNKPAWDDGTGVAIGDHTFFKLGYGGGGKDGRERVRMAALGQQASGTASDAAYGDKPVASIPGDDPAKLRADADRYEKTNPEAARQLRARADAASAPQDARPVQMAQAQTAGQAPVLGPGATMNDLMPDYATRRARIQQGLKSPNIWVQQQAIKDAESLNKEFNEKQKLLFESQQKRDISGFEQGNQNYRHGQTETRQRDEHRDKFGLDTRKQDFEERKGVNVDGQIVNPATGEVIRGRDQSRALVKPEDRAAFGIQKDDKRPYTVGPDGKLQVTAGDPKTTINNFANPLAKGIAEQFNEDRKAAKGAADTIVNIHEARNALDSGKVVTGLGANARLDMNRAGALFGITDTTAIAKTETFRAAIGQSVLDRAKALGANPTDSDRRYINDVMAGNIELNEKSIRNILDIQERTMRRKIDQHNEEAGRIGESDDDLKSVRGMMGVKVPPSYDDFKKALPKEPEAPAFTREQIEAEIARRKGGRM